MDLMARRAAMMEPTKWRSSKGIWYTKNMTIDINNASSITSKIAQFGTMDHLEELELIGIMRQASARNVLPTDVNTTWTYTPALKRLIIRPSEVRDGQGYVIPTSDTGYSSTTGTGKFLAGHYAFNNTNLEYLQLGCIGCLWGGGGYFRSDGVKCIGSDIGMTLVIYTNSSTTNGFSGSVHPTTTIIRRDWQTGEILTA